MYTNDMNQEFNRIVQGNNPAALVKLLREQEFYFNEENFDVIEETIKKGKLNILEVICQYGKSHFEHPAAARYLIYSLVKTRLNVLPFVKELLTVKDINLGENQNQIFLEAAAKGHTGVVDLLLKDSRFDPIGDHSLPGFTDAREAVIFAAENGHINVVERILQDERVSKYQFVFSKAFWGTIEKNQPKIVKIMLEILLTDPVKISPETIQEEFLKAVQDDNTTAVQWLLMKAKKGVISIDNNTIEKASGFAKEGCLNILLGKDSSLTQDNIDKDFQETIKEVNTETEFKAQPEIIDKTFQEVTKEDNAETQFKIQSETTDKDFQEVTREDNTDDINQGFKRVVQEDNPAALAKFLREKRFYFNEENFDVIEETIRKGKLNILEVICQHGRSHFKHPTAARYLIYKLVDTSLNVFPLVEELLKIQDINLSENQNQIFLAAAAKGHIGVIELLLKDSRFDPIGNKSSHEFPDAHHAVNFAANNGHINVVERILQDQRVSKHPSVFRKALWVAIEKNQPNIVKMLLEKFRFNYTDEDLFTAFLSAIEYDKAHSFESLLAEKVIADKFKNSPKAIEEAFIKAVKADNSTVVQWLLMKAKKGVISIDNKTIETAFRFVKGNSLNILLGEDSPLTQIDINRAFTKAASNKEGGPSVITKLLSQTKFKIQPKTIVKAFQKAVKKNNTDVLEIILKDTKNQIICIRDILATPNKLETEEKSKELEILLENGVAFPFSKLPPDIQSVLVSLLPKKLDSRSEIIIPNPTQKAFYTNFHTASYITSFSQLQNLLPSFNLEVLAKIHNLTQKIEWDVNETEFGTEAKEKFKLEGKKELFANIKNNLNALNLSSISTQQESQIKKVISDTVATYFTNDENFTEQEELSQIIADKILIKLKSKQIILNKINEQVKDKLNQLKSTAKTQEEAHENILEFTQEHESLWPDLHQYWLCNLGNIYLESSRSFVPVFSYKNTSEKDLVIRTLMSKSSEQLISSTASNLISNNLDKTLLAYAKALQDFNYEKAAISLENYANEIKDKNEKGYQALIDYANELKKYSAEQKEYIQEALAKFTEAFKVDSPVYKKDAFIGMMQAMTEFASNLSPLERSKYILDSMIEALGDTANKEIPKEIEMRLKQCFIAYFEEAYPGTFSSQAIQAGNIKNLVIAYKAYESYKSHINLPPEFKKLASVQEGTPITPGHIKSKTSPPKKDLNNNNVENTGKVHRPDKRK